MEHGGESRKEWEQQLKGRRIGRERKGVTVIKTKRGRRLTWEQQSLSLWTQLSVNSKDWSSTQRRSGGGKKGGNLFSISIKRMLWLLLLERRLDEMGRSLLYSATYFHHSTI
jgi:hypothetical protein